MMQNLIVFWHIMVLQVQKCRCHSCSEVVRHSNYFSAKLYVLVGCDQWDNLVFALICGDNKNTVCNH